VLPSLKTVRAGLRGATEALASELARPGAAVPGWSDLGWRLAMAASAAHGVSPLLWKHSGWTHPHWRRFLEGQHEHVAVRHARIVALLEHIVARSRAAGLAMVPLKGAALHALDIYTPGERPMGDVDLLVHEDEADRATRLLRAVGYVPSFADWRHRVFKPAAGTPPAVLGEHRDTPVNIELHTRIRERLPVSVVDITERILPRVPEPGLNPYRSRGALLAHLLLHAAGNMCGHSLRLIHLHDIALLARSLQPEEWMFLWRGGACWWAVPPLQMVARYYRGAIPDVVLATLARDCPLLLRSVSRRRTLANVSASELWLHAFPGIEWSRNPLEAARFIARRIRPSAEKTRERREMARTQLWLRNRDWVTAPQARRIFTWLTRKVPRMDMMHVVRMALARAAPATGENFDLANRAEPGATAPRRIEEVLVRESTDDFRHSVHLQPSAVVAQGGRFGPRADVS
jgi:hypothetical protein